MKIFIVIPAFNEEQHIAETVARVLAAGPYSIVVVDDGSTDATYARASELVCTLRHVVNRGMGAALATGTAYALEQGADTIVHFDADGQHQAPEISRFIEPLASDTADIVLGSRYLQKNTLPWSKKYLIHKPALFFQNRTTGMNLTDVHNGFRAMNRIAAKAIHIRQDRMAHASEIIAEIKKNQLRYSEVPVTIAYREYGQGFSEGVKIYRDLLIKKIFK